MAYRNDKDALLERAGALDRENERLKNELGSAEGERDDLRTQLDANDRELKKLRKKLDKLEKQPAGAQDVTKKLVLGGAIVLAAMAGVAVFVLSAKGDQHAETAVSEPERPAETSSSKRTPKVAMKTPANAPEAEIHDPALAEYNAVYTIRWCLDTTDLVLRSILLIDEPVERRLPSTFESGETAAAQACADELADIERDEDLPAVAIASKAYREALEVIRPVVVELHRYYEEEDFEDDSYAGAKTLLATLARDGAAYRAASDALREVYLPEFHRVRDAEGDRILATSPKAHAMWRARALATDFIDTVFATPLSFARLERSMAAINTFRADHKELDFDRAVTFYKFAKRLFRALRDRGPTPTLTIKDAHELRMLSSYYSMAKFAQDGPSRRAEL